MSQNWLYINSPRWRTFVAATRENRLLFWGSTGIACAAAALAATLTMNATNPNMEAEGYKDKSQELARLPLHTQVGYI